MKDFGWLISGNINSIMATVWQRFTCGKTPNAPIFHWVNRNGRERGGLMVMDTRSIDEAHEMAHTVSFFESCHRGIAILGSTGSIAYNSYRK